MISVNSSEQDSDSSLDCDPDSDPDPAPAPLVPGPGFLLVVSDSEVGLHGGGEKSPCFNDRRKLELTSDHCVCTRRLEAGSGR